MATKIKKRAPHKQSAPAPPKRQFLVSAELTKEYKSQIMESERQTVMDFVSIALGRMGFRASKFQKFRETLSEVYMDYANLIAEVKEDDPQLWEVFGKIDRELYLYVGKDLFEPWDKRHS
jgi:acyl carrier protein phosphodiesterase